MHSFQVWLRLCLSVGRICARTVPVQSSSLSYEDSSWCELWEKKATHRHTFTVNVPFLWIPAALSIYAAQPSPGFLDCRLFCVFHSYLSLRIGTHDSSPVINREIFFSFLKTRSLLEAVGHSWFSTWQGDVSFCWPGFQPLLCDWWMTLDEWGLSLTDPRSLSLKGNDRTDLPRREKCHMH